MALVTYKMINLKSHLKSSIDEQLEVLDFQSAPYVFNILNLKEKQLEALLNIELFLKQFSVNLLPYTIYLISNCKSYPGSLALFEDQSSLPSFFANKSRSLSIKENTILKKVELKKEKFKSIQSKEYFSVLKDYGIQHKKLNRLYQESEYLHKISSRIELINATSTMNNNKETK